VPAVEVTFAVKVTAFFSMTALLLEDTTAAEAVRLTVPVRTSCTEAGKESVALA
jgi:hypothetical protein